MLTNKLATLKLRKLGREENEEIQKDFLMRKTNYKLQWKIVVLTN